MAGTGEQPISGTQVSRVQGFPSSQSDAGIGAHTDPVRAEINGAEVSVVAQGRTSSAETESHVSLKVHGSPSSQGSVLNSWMQSPLSG